MSFSTKYRVETEGTGQGKSSQCRIASKSQKFFHNGSRLQIKRPEYPSADFALMEMFKTALLSCWAVKYYHYLIQTRLVGSHTPALPVYVLHGPRWSTIIPTFINSRCGFGKMSGHSVKKLCKIIRRNQNLSVKLTKFDMISSIRRFVFFLKNQLEQKPFTRTSACDMLQKQGGKIHNVRHILIRRE